MKLTKNISISLIALATLLLSCKDKPRVDLAKLTFTEKAESVINFDDRYAGGINTVDAPLSFALQASRSSSFSFNGMNIDSANIIFQMRSDKIRKDTSLYQSGGTADQDHVANSAELHKVLQKFRADSVIYAYRVGIKTKELQSAILKELIKLYGPGIKNPGTDNGLYWNMKSQHRFAFYAPDYRWLIVVDNTHLSKTCFWDAATGNIDFGDCDMAQYKTNLFK
ncbi:hypothetical protein SAMN05216464_103229 [Mucilaginibacter pineti]|uniref:Lipoprotein n=1 Tax=Mucilaginibacter pineti TaxID=1391627 RepID=A0A1G6Z5X4_9SPHI|nr:hypothetical protein [Mucilaginibacter pineti]SDD98010.1 hypothetical protein SAMN05216464_103229 [Mucilaginibacter pineti]